MNIDLHIEELVLHGFPPGDRRMIADAVRAELARLFAEGGAHLPLAAGGERARIDGGAFHVQTGAGPDGIGAQIARAVHGGLSR